eukprot:12274-Chlamydomonas_euryale.AAC.3
MLRAALGRCASRVTRFERTHLRTAAGSHSAAPPAAARLSAASSHVTRRGSSAPRQRAPCARPWTSRRATMSTGRSDLLRRHNEIRSALSFFLHQWHKHRLAGTTPSASAAAADFARFRALEAVVRRVQEPGLGSGSVSTDRWGHR